MISHKESHSFLNTDQNCFHRHHKDLMLPNVPDKLCIQACEPRTRQKKQKKNNCHQEPSFIRDVSTVNILYPRRIFLRILTLRSMDPWPDRGSSTNHFFFIIPISNTVEHTELISIGLFIDNIFSWLLIICTGIYRIYADQKSYWPSPRILCDFMQYPPSSVTCFHNSENIT